MAQGDIKDAKFVIEFANSDHPDAKALRELLNNHETIMVERRKALRVMAEAQAEAKRLGLVACKSALAVHDAYKKLKPDAAKVKKASVNARREEAYAMFRSGYRISEIAKHFDVSQSVISSDIHRSARRAGDICWNFEHPTGIKAWGGWVWRNPPLKNNP